MSQVQTKTQILITDIPKEKFTQKWPNTIETLLFKTKFPELKSKLQYFTPLPFLQRIIIILDDPQSAMKLFEFLRDGDYIQKPLKLFLTESLLSGSSRSRSFDDSASNDSIPFDRTTNPFLDLNKHTISNDLQDGSSQDNSTRPILSLETNPLKTGISSGSLAVGSPSLSPDNGTLESPTLLKFNKDDKPHYYREPLPRTTSNSSLTKSENYKHDNGNNNNNNKDGTPFNTFTRDEDKISKSDEEFNLNIERHSTSVSTATPPKSPSITINSVFP